MSVNLVKVKVADTDYLPDQSSNRLKMKGFKGFQEFCLLFKTDSFSLWMFATCVEPFQTELHQLNSCLKSSGVLQNQLRCFECQRAET